MNLETFVEKGSDGLFSQTVVLKLVETKESSNRWIRNVLDDAFTVFAINKELRQSGQSDRFGLLKKGVDGVLQDVL